MKEDNILTPVAVEGVTRGEEVLNRTIERRGGRKMRLREKNMVETSGIQK